MPSRLFSVTAFIDASPRGVDRMCTNEQSDRGHSPLSMAPFVRLVAADRARYSVTHITTSQACDLTGPNPGLHTVHDRPRATGPECHAHDSRLSTTDPDSDWAE